MYSLVYYLIRTFPLGHAFAMINSTLRVTLWAIIYLYGYCGSSFSEIQNLTFETETKRNSEEVFNELTSFERDASKDGNLNQEVELKDQNNWKPEAQVRG